MKKGWTGQWQARRLFMELLVMSPPAQNTANLKLNKILYFEDMEPFNNFQGFPIIFTPEVSKKTALQCLQTYLSVRRYQVK
jgi:hypothetical protein